MSPARQRSLHYGGAVWGDTSAPYGAVREPVLVRCTTGGCPSLMVMPPGTTPQGQAIRLEVADWTTGPDGPVCDLDHDQRGPAAATTPWWRRLWARP